MPGHQQSDRIGCDLESLVNRISVLSQVQIRFAPGQREKLVRGVWLATGVRNNMSRAPGLDKGPSLLQRSIQNSLVVARTVRAVRKQHKVPAGKAGQAPLAQQVQASDIGTVEVSLSPPLFVCEGIKGSQKTLRVTGEIEHQSGLVSLTESVECDEVALLCRHVRPGKLFYQRFDTCELMGQQPAQYNRVTEVNQHRGELLEVGYQCGHDHGLVLLGKDRQREAVRTHHLEAALVGHVRHRLFPVRKVQDGAYTRTRYRILRQTCGGENEFVGAPLNAAFGRLAGTLVQAVALLAHQPLHALAAEPAALVIPAILPRALGVALALPGFAVATGKETTRSAVCNHRVLAIRYRVARVLSTPVSVVAKRVVRLVRHQVARLLALVHCADDAIIQTGHGTGHAAKLGTAFFFPVAEDPVSALPVVSHVLALTVSRAAV